MAKRKKPKQATKGNESPEKAIIKRGRNLPLFECNINKDWIYSKLAQIIIARKHTNGNVTFAAYLVDLFCKGVYDTFFKFNVPEADYKAYLKEVREELELVPYSYETLHNIIYGAVEFAEELGIHPHPQFDVTKYLLLEDTDDVPLLDIQFGYKGKPVVVIYDDDKKPEELNILKSRLKEGEYEIRYTKDDDVYFDVENEIFKEDIQLIKNAIENQKLTENDNIDELEEVAELLFYSRIREDRNIAKKNEILYMMEDIIKLQGKQRLKENNKTLSEGCRNLAEKYERLVSKRKTRKLKKLLPEIEKTAKNEGDSVLYELVISGFGFLKKWDVALEKINEARQMFSNGPTWDFYECRYLLAQQKPLSIIELFNHKYTVSGFFQGNEIDINHVINYLNFMGVYFISLENIRQAQQYLQALEMLENDGEFLKVVYEDFRVRLIQKMIKIALEDEGHLKKLINKSL